MPPASQSGPVPFAGAAHFADFDQSFAGLQKQIEAELEQEAAAAGLTMEEYIASDYEAPAQPTFPSTRRRPAQRGALPLPFL